MNSQYTDSRGEEYFESRRHRRSTVAQQMLSLQFSRHIKSSDVVVDFGCGTGGILESISCFRKIGIEINELSRREAASKHIEVYSDLKELPSSFADVAISNHALEHVQDPYRMIVELNRILKPGGTLVLNVPFESKRRTSTWYKDSNHHLFSWTPLTLGNLLTSAGFEVKHASIKQAGHSRFIFWLRKVPWAYVAASFAIAHVLDRFHTICVASKS